ncbi:MAG: hypothetical protein VKN33_01755 [Candidatus Sericytochromatia bacterium]|nr:hypothetical protein [Candidatus Sericytochromatia bacterium]
MAPRHPASKTQTDSHSMAEVLVRGLDHLQVFIEHNTKTLEKSDWLASQQRILEQVLENTKRSIHRIAGPEAPPGPADIVHAILLCALEDTHDILGVVQAEAERTHLIETITAMTQNGVLLLKQEIDLGFEAGGLLNQFVADTPALRTWGWLPARKSDLITRVEIEADTGNIHPISGS